MFTVNVTKRPGNGVMLTRTGPSLLSSQIAAAIRTRVLSGEWPLHYKLKAETDLAAEFGVARGTLRKALHILINEGLLVQVHGRGTFVNARAEDLPLAERIVTLSEIFAQSGATFSIEVLEMATSRGPERIRSLLDVGATEELFRLRRRFISDGSPAAIVDNYVRLARCPTLPTVDFAERSLFDVLENDGGLNIDLAQRTFSAMTDPSINSLLGLHERAPLLYIEQVTYTSNEPLEYSDVWLDGDHLRIPVVLRGRRRATRHVSEAGRSVEAARSGD